MSLRALLQWGSLYLSSTLQLIHGRVVGWLPSSTFGGSDKFSESLGHVPHRVYQNHLRKQSRCECKHNGQSSGLSSGPWGEDLTLEPLSLLPIYDTLDLGEGRTRHARRVKGKTRCVSDETAITRRALAAQIEEDD